MILAATVMHLHGHWSFIGLNVAPVDQFLPHGGGDGHQQLTHLQNPAVQRGPAQFYCGVALQHRTLPIERQVVTVFIDHRVDHDAITDQALLNHPRWQGRRDYTLLGARAAGTLLAFAHSYKVVGWLHIQLRAFFVADHHFLGSTAWAKALLGRAGQHLLHAFHVVKQFLPVWVLPTFLFRYCRYLFALALRLHFTSPVPVLPLQYLQLGCRKLFT